MRSILTCLILAISLFVSTTAIAKPVHHQHRSHHHQPHVVRKRHIPPTLPTVHHDMRPGHIQVAKSPDDEELDCLAQAMYREAYVAGDTVMFQVGYVVMHRRDHPKFPKSICQVVHQKLKVERRIRGRVHHVASCQFSWYCNPKKRHIDYASEEYQHARKLAPLVYHGLAPNYVGNDVFFKDANEAWLARAKRGLSDYIHDGVWSVKRRSMLMASAQ